MGTIKSKVGTYFLYLGVFVFFLSLFSEWYNQKDYNTDLEKQKEYLEKLILENKYSIRSHDSLISALELKYGDRRESVEIVNRRYKQLRDEQNYINTLPLDSTVRNLSKWLSEKGSD
jgi:hypothetical protein